MLTDRRLKPRAFSLHAALLALSVAVCSLCSTTLAAQAIGTAFTYQGELTAAGVPANASYDMEFRAFDALTDGAQIGPTVTRPAVPVSHGLFSVALDFGAGQFAGDRQWLEIRIRPAGSGSYETLLPRTEITAAPYALGAAVALADSVSTTSIVDGSVGAADIDTNQVQRRVSGVCATNEFMRGVDASGAVNCVAGSLGTVTRINAGAGLTGGPITLQGTLSIADGGVTSLMIANGTVANVDLAPNAVNAGNIVDGSVGLADINTAQVQARVGGSCAVGQYVRAIAADGTVTCGSDATGTPGWALGGNAGTDPASQFLGTTDAQPLVLRTANAASLRLQPSSLTFGSPALPITSNVIAGSHANEVALGVRGATIAGGGLPSGNSDPSFIDEGPNRVTDSFGTIGGGYANRAGRDVGTPTINAFATVGGGFSNTASGNRSTVAGGGSSSASGYASTVSGGQDNDASGDFSVVAGGGENAAVGSSSAVGGGAFNCAGGGRSWAGGFRAKIRPATNPGSGPCSGLPSYPGGPGDEGSFIWADYQFEDFVSTGPGQFLVRAGGGFSSTPTSPCSARTTWC